MQEFDEGEKHLGVPIASGSSIWTPLLLVRICQLIITAEVFHVQMCQTLSIALRCLSYRSALRRYHFIENEALNPYRSLDHVAWIPA